MILAMVRVHVPQKKNKEVAQTIRGVLEPTRVEPGCLAIRCSRDIEDENVLVIEEEWATREDWERHVRSEGYKVTLSFLELASTQPDMRYYEVTEAEGIEKILKMRGSCPY